MRNNANLSLFVLTLSASIVFYSCQKSIQELVTKEQMRNEANTSSQENHGVTPYKFERINEHNFYSQGWKKEQGNVVGPITVFSDSSDNMEIVCGPDNDADPRLIPGSITMNLLTSADPTLRRIRLRKGGYSGTLLADLTELKYSTYVVEKAPTIMVLIVDINNDGARDFNIFFSPTPLWQGVGYPPVILNTWQQWNALEGLWHFEPATISGLPEASTIEELIALHPNARIIDTAPAAQGVYFTIGGIPRSVYENTIGYFDALIIGTKNEQVSTLYDFTCNQSNN